MSKSVTKIPGKTKFDRFQFMRGIGYSELEIRIELDIPTEDAFKQMDEKAANLAKAYLRYLVKTGHIQNLVNGLKIQWESVFALQKRANALAEQCEKHPTDRKLAYAESHLRQTLNVAMQTVTDMSKDVPLAEGFNLFIKENIIEGGAKRRGTNIHNMPVSPADLTN